LLVVRKWVRQCDFCRRAHSRKYFVKKPIIWDLLFVCEFIGNKTTNGFKEGQRIPNKKKIILKNWGILKINILKLSSNKKWIVLLTWRGESKKKMNQNENVDKLSVEMAEFVVMKVWFVIK
jgi:hypothetical protein